MPNEKPNPDATPADSPHRTRDWDVLEREAVYLMTDPDRYPPIWSIEDLGRELEYFDPESVIRQLRNAGLVHRTSDNFVFATAAAYRMVQMVGEVV
jgi:hypothetical protein